MAEPSPERLADIKTKLQSGLRVYARSEGRTRTVQLANELSAVHTQLDDTELPTVEETSDIRVFFGGVDRDLQRTRKITEVVEDNLQVGLGHSKLARLAMTGAQLNSGVALVIAGHNLLISANKLDRAHASLGSIQDIGNKRFHEFYRAIALFTAEAILFTTPLNYRIAWKGTRFLNNKFLYALRHSGFSKSIDTVLKGLHRLVLSEIHYAIRGILPASLRAPEKFVTYLTAMAAQTLGILREFSNIGITEIPAKTEEVVNEYLEFAKDTYEFVVPDVDIEAVIQDVVSQLTSDIDFFSVNPPHHTPTL